MALYDLTALKRGLIEAFKTEPIVEEVQRLMAAIDTVRNAVPNMDEQHRAYVDQLTNHYQQVLQLAQAPRSELAHRINMINQQIDSLVHELFYNNYELEERYGTVQSVRVNRKINISPDVEQDIKQRILLYTSWRYPGLEIGCRDGEWTQFMVASDPLYVMDRHKEFLDSTLSLFSPEYQRRLRPYQLVDHDLSALPDNQFGFVFSWGYFNYVSIDTIKKYLQQIYVKLRPGGIFMFSYNDGDTPAGAALAETFAQTYMPKSMLMTLVQSMGFEPVADFDCDGNVSWLEIRKPGVLHTSKAHQALGEILPK